MPRDNLGDFEQVVLLAVLRLGDQAYAPAIHEEIERWTDRATSLGAMYVTLDRLEAKRLIRSRLGPANAERGGRPRRFVTVTAAGLRQLRATRQTLLSLWRGLEPLLDA